MNKRANNRSDLIHPQVKARMTAFARAHQLKAIYYTDYGGSLEKTRRYIERHEDRVTRSTKVEGS